MQGGTRQEGPASETVGGGKILGVAVGYQRGGTPWSGSWIPGGGEFGGATGLPNVLRQE